MNSFSILQNLFVIQNILSQISDESEKWNEKNKKKLYFLSLKIIHSFIDSYV